MTTLLLVSANPQRRQLWTDAFSQARHKLILISPANLAHDLQTLSVEAVLIDACDHDALPALEVARMLGGRPGTRLLVACTDPEDSRHLTWLQAGACALCPGDTEPALLRRMLDAVTRGEIWVSKSITAQLLKQYRSQADKHPSSNTNRQTLPELSQRKSEIARLIAKGASNKDIALLLGITERTVKFHLTDIYQRAGVPDRVRLALLLNTPETRTSTGGE